MFGRAGLAASSSPSGRATTGVVVSWEITTASTAKAVSRKRGIRPGSAPEEQPARVPVHGAVDQVLRAGHGRSVREADPVEVAVGPGEVDPTLGQGHALHV